MKLIRLTFFLPFIIFISTCTSLDQLGNETFSASSAGSIITNAVVTNTNFSYTADSASKILPQIVWSNKSTNRFMIADNLLFCITDNRSITLVQAVWMNITNTLSTNADGLYVFSIPPATPSGFQTLIVLADDNDSNRQNLALTIDINNPIDTPVALWSYPPNNSWISSNTILSGTIFLNNSVLNPFQPVLILTNDRVYTQASVSGTNWECNFILPNMPNHTVIQVFAIATSSQNKSSTNIRQFRIDNSPPLLHWSAPTAGSTIANTGFVISGSVEDAESSLAQVTVQQSSNWQKSIFSTNFNIRFDGSLYGGDFVFTLTASNFAGISVSTQVTLHANAIAQVSNLLPAENTLVSNNTIHLKGSASINGSTITNLVLCLSNTNGTILYAVIPISTPTNIVNWDTNVDWQSLPDGKVFLLPIATSSTGLNNLNIIKPLSVTKDVLAPTFAFATTNLTNHITYTTNLLGTAFDSGAGIASLTFIISNSASLTTQEIQGYGYHDVSWNIPMSVVPGKNSFSVVASDTIGRTNLTTSSFTVILTPHTILIDGTNDFWSDAETFDANSGITTLLTWNTNSIYLGLQSPDLTASGQAFYVAISTNISYGLSSLPYGINREGSSVHIPIRAQFFVYFVQSGSELNKYITTISNGMWVTLSNNFTSLDAVAISNYAEFRIDRSVFGNVNAIHIATWCKDLQNTANPGWGWLYGAFPNDTTDTSHDGINDKWLTRFLNITLNSNSIPNTNTVSTVLNPILSVVHSYKPIANNTTVDFGTILLGTTNSISLNLFNHGSNSLTINGLSLTGDPFFALQTNWQTVSLEQNSFTQITLLYTPTTNTNQTSSAQIQINSDSIYNPVFVLSLTGIGTNLPRYPVSPNFVSTQYISYDKDGTNTGTNTQAYGDGHTYQPFNRIVEITCVSNGVYFYYTTDNWITTNLYTNSFTISGTTTIQAYAVTNGFYSSSNSMTNFQRTILQTTIDTLGDGDIYFTGTAVRFNSWNTKLMGQWNTNNIWKWVTWEETSDFDWKALHISGDLTTTNWMNDPNRHATIGTENIEQW